MMDAGRHPNIELLEYSEVVDVHGYVGNFEVRVRRKPRYVNVDLCTGCGQCVEACVLLGGKGQLMVPSEFEAGLGKRGAAYIPFPQAVPLKAVIDPESCLWLLKGKCSQKCVKVCERKAIDFEMQETFLDLKVGTIVVATGFDLYDVSGMYQYGYGRYPNVLDGLQFERMTSNGGPTEGRILTADGREPQAIAFLHCIGSRDEAHKSYCSRVCCMYAMKQAHLAHELSGADVYEFYIDIRAPGKGYEEFYERIQREGIHFIRGKVAEVGQEDGRLLVRAEDTLDNSVVEVPVDMVVLITAMQPAAGSTELGQLLGISCDKDGWFAEAHPKLRPVETNTDGVFLAGSAQSPKDVPDTVAHAGAAASMAIALMNQGEVTISPAVAVVDEKLCSACKTCISLCPYTAISFIDAKNVAHVNEALCKGCGTCVAACPASAIVARHFTDEQILVQVEELLREPEPELVPADD
jgi:heterodisulfide reductase subunit A